MRILLASHLVYTEYTSGAARSLRTIMTWLAACGHTCQVLSAATFEATPGETLMPHLQRIGIDPRSADGSGPCRVHTYELDGVAVRVLENKAQPPDVDRQEARQYSALFDSILAAFQPDTVLTYGNHPVLQPAMGRAKARGASIVVTLRAYGYEDRAYFSEADRVLCNSPFLTRHYADRIGLRSTPLPSPIIWSEVQGTSDTRGFVTFVNPAPHKGLALFVRLADMLGRRRPDIPILIVQSALGAEPLTALRGLDLTRYPQIVTMPPIASTADLFSLCKILLVPSVSNEPFGRVAAEAMINGVPAIVSDRGNLPDTVREGGIVLPLPSWLESASRAVPEEAEVEPWFEAVVRLWDDAAYYEQVSTAGRVAAERLYGEANLMSEYDRYFRAGPPHEPLF
jgi:glycosyltransferase involved in cell wall biosynthesis